MTLYIDLILIENIIMNYILILSTGMVCKINIKYRRIFIGSLIGAIYALGVCIIGLELYINRIIKLIVSVCMIYISFKSSNIKILVKQLLIFYLTSFCFSGVIYYLLNNMDFNIIKDTNGVFREIDYIRIVILGGVIGFLLINISFGMIKNKLTKQDIIYEVEIFYKEKSSKVKVILDTGNLLTEPMTRVPVLIVEAEKLKNIVPKKILNNIEDIIYKKNFENIEDDIKLRCRIIPFSSIGKSNGIIIGFKPDYIKIHTGEGKKVRKKVILGIYNNKIVKNGIYSGLIGLNLLNEGEEV